MSLHTVLVVDDSLIIRKVLVKTLDSLGYKALSVPSGQEALDLVQVGRTKPHLRGIRSVLDKRLKCLAGLFEGLVELLFHPAKRGEIDVVSPFGVLATFEDCSTFLLLF